MWAPNERSLAYAYHVQVATDEHPDAEVVSMQDGMLQSADEGEGVKVETVEGGAENLKPMNM